MYVRKKKVPPFISTTKSNTGFSSAADFCPARESTDYDDQTFNLDAFKDFMCDAETGEPISMSKARWNRKEGRLSLNTATILAMGTGRLDIKTREMEAQLEQQRLQEEELLRKSISTARSGGGLRQKSFRLQNTGLSRMASTNGPSLARDASGFLSSATSISTGQASLQRFNSVISHTSGADIKTNVTIGDADEKQVSLFRQGTNRSLPGAGEIRRTGSSSGGGGGGGGSNNQLPHLSKLLSTSHSVVPPSSAAVPSMTTLTTTTRTGTTPPFTAASAASTAAASTASFSSSSAPPVSVRRHPLLTQFMKQGPLDPMRHIHWDPRSNTVRTVDEEGKPLDIAEEDVDYYSVQEDKPGEDEEDEQDGEGSLGRKGGGRNGTRPRQRPSSADSSSVFSATSSLGSTSTLSVVVAGGGGGMGMGMGNGNRRGNGNINENKRRKGGDSVTGGVSVGSKSGTTSGGAATATGSKGRRVDVSMQFVDPAICTHLIRL
jgi:hypothetical protein